MSPAPQAGLVTHSADEIARILESVQVRGTLLTCYLPEVVFQSLLRKVDARAGRIVLERSPVEAANAALLAGARCTFHCELPGWHLEFIAAAPRATLHGDARAIELEFPQVLSSQQRRTHPRGDVKAPLALRCLADAGGITPFEANVVDIGLGGIGLLLYARDIVLEPGTLLRGCRIEVPGRGACIVDLEVRYSQPVAFPDGRQAMRSGCRFVNPTPEVLELARLYISE